MKAYKTDEEPVRVAAPGGEPAGAEATLYRRDNTPCSRGTYVLYRFIC